MPTAHSNSDFGRQAGESHRDYFKREFSALKPFVIISLSYLLFTTTDGAVSWALSLVLFLFSAYVAQWPVICWKQQRFGAHCNYKFLYLPDLVNRILQLPCPNASPPATHTCP